MDKRQEFIKWCKGRYDISNPKTIQDKIQWLKLYDSTPLKTKCADKILLHEYCKEKLGEDICIPILKIFDGKNIKFDGLPNSFVLKCNHGSGMNIIVKDKSKLDKNAAVKRLSAWLDSDFAIRNQYEWHYHNIQHKAYVEKYMNDGHNDLIDYKFLCFNGIPMFCQVISDRSSKMRHLNYYNMNWEPCKELSRIDFPANYNIQHEKPKSFDTMMKYAEILAKDFKFVRVDFYEINGKIYLGELTFTPGSGTFKYKNKSDELYVGNLLKL